MKQKKLCVVCCQHGNEIFGKTVFDFFEKRASKYPQIELIFANPKAFQHNKRFINSDLNRSFGQQDGLKGYEAEIAPEILARAKRADYVIDIHTTTAKIKYCTIVTDLDKSIRFMLSHIPSEKVVLIESSEAPASLIGNVAAGVSIELNESFAKQTQALNIVVQIIEGILSSKPGKYREKELFKVNGTISNKTLLPSGSQNFKLVPSLAIYPILLGEKNYTDYQSFSAKDRIELTL